MLATSLKLFNVKITYILPNLQDFVAFYTGAIKMCPGGKNTCERQMTFSAAISLGCACKYFVVYLYNQTGVYWAGH